MAFWDQKTFCLITGASRGIGKCIATEFAKKVGNESVLLLVARNETALLETKTEILSSSGQRIQLQVVTAGLDLGKPEASVYHQLILSALSTAGKTPSDFDHFILVHNAGSLGDITRRVLEQDNVTDIQNYFAFNIFSLVILTSQFFKIFNDASKQRSIIQISSLGAVKPFKTWGLYCAGKAARDMLMRSIAEEEGSSISTFNYAPGPVDTDIYTEAVANTGDTELKELFASSRQKGDILTCNQTVTKLVRLLGEKKYTKGEHVDYYDVE